LDDLHHVQTILHTNNNHKNTAHPEARKERGPQIFWRIITLNYPAKSTKPRKGGNDIISTAAAAAETSAAPEGNVRTFQAQVRGEQSIWKTRRHRKGMQKKS
jgi:hypothetical protein